MNKKSILGLLLFGCLVLAGLFYGATLMTRYGTGANAHQMRQEETNDLSDEDASSNSIKNTKDIVQKNQIVDYANEEPWLSANPSDNGDLTTQNTVTPFGISEAGGDITDQSIENSDHSEEQGNNTLSENLTKDEKRSATDKLNEVKRNDSLVEKGAGLTPASNISGGVILEAPVRELIKDYTQVDYKAYIPEMIYNKTLESALAVDNPSISIKAQAAILIDAETKKVLYYKNPVIAVFPASTAKLLTALTALDWCKLEEEVTIGEEVKLIASDSTRANLYKGQILTIKNLLEGMLLPSGNDAAYVIATYAGRKSLKMPDASAEDAVTEFVRLMNAKAKMLGVINSCFKTPDGYDALGQYTTAYDMGLIGLAAIENDTILEIAKKSDSRNVFISGQDVTWYNTNALIKRSSGRYYPYCIGLKTGTSTMAGKCLVAAGRKNGREVISVVLNSTSSGRWNDTIALLDYGLSR